MENIEGAIEIKNSSFREKLPLILALGAVFVVSAGMYFGVQKIQDTAYFSNNSLAADGTRSLVKPRVCEKCDAGGGAQYCKNRFDELYGTIRKKKPKLSEFDVIKKAYSEMDTDDPNSPYDEEKCGYCDLSPQRQKLTSWTYGDRNMNQLDIDAYNFMCVSPTATPKPEPTQPPQAQPSSLQQGTCAACDFDGDGRFSQFDADKLNQCIFTSGMSSCVNSDINADGKVDAGDSAAAVVCASNASAFSNCIYADRDKNGIIDTIDATIISRCAFVANINVCYNKDANNDGKIDAGDLSWCPLYCAGSTTEQIQTLNLQAGWQLISLYIEPRDPDVKSIFASALAIPDNEFKAFTYAGAQWKFFYNKVPISTGLNIHAGEGIWIYTTNSSTIQVSGTLPSGKMPGLKEDQYNLVGLTSNAPQPVSGVIDLSRFPNTKIWRFRTGQQTLTGSSDFDLVVSPDIINVAGVSLEPGVGYWIHLNPQLPGVQGPQNPPGN